MAAPEYVPVSLNELPRPTAWQGPLPGDPYTGLLAVSPSVEYLERAWDDAKYGRTSEHPYVEAVFPTAHEPGLAPEGKHVMLAFTQYGATHPKDGPSSTARRASEAIAETPASTMSSSMNANSGPDKFSSSFSRPEGTRKYVSRW